MSSRGSRRYCFTLNNWTESNWKELSTLNWVTYLCMAKEIAPTTKTPHLQGYFELKNAKTISAIKKLLNTCPHIHLEAAIANGDKNKKYCSKSITIEVDGDKWFETGEMKQQGKRTDLEAVAELAKNTSISMKNLANEYSTEFIKYHKGIEKLRFLQYEHRTERPIVIWRWGPSGTGKTYKPCKEHKSHFIKDSSNWWDGYTQQEAIIIDDFEANIEFRDLLRLLDEQQYTAYVKGGSIPVNSKYIYITCEHHPNTLYHGTHYTQVRRRISQIIHVKERGVEIIEEDN